MTDSLANLRLRSARWFTAACLYHTALALAAIIILVRYNRPNILPDPANTIPVQLWFHSAVLGFLAAI
jgi:hypothetical protein